MIQIFAVREDGLGHQELDLDLTDLLEDKPPELSLRDLSNFSTLNAEMSSWWSCPSVDFITRPACPEGLIPDISLWDSATLVLSPKAHRYLKDSLGSYGEFLPVLVGDENYQIFNCLRISEADDNNCEFDYDGDTKLGICKLAFTPGAEDNLVFKTPLEACITVFCNTKFKEAVESFGLTGIIFDQTLITPSPFE